MGRCLLAMISTFADKALVDEDLGVPETVLGTVAEEGVGTLDRLILDKEIFLAFFLNQSVQKGHWLVRLCQIVLKDGPVVQWGIFFSLE